MANTELIGGVDTYFLYAKESVFGTPVTANLHIGLYQDSNFTPGRNLRERRGVVTSTTSGQEFVTKTQGTYDSQLTVNFEPINFAHLEAIMGTLSGNGSSGTPFTHTRAQKPPSFTLAENLINVEDDQVYRHSGAVCESWQMRGGENEAPAVSMQWKIKETEILDTLLTNTALPAGDPYNFDGWTIEAPTNTELTHIVKGWTLRIRRDLRWRYGPSVTAQSYGFGFIYYEIDLEVASRDDFYAEKYLGGATIGAPTPFATMQIELTNGANRWVRFTYTGVYIDDRPQSIRIGEDVSETVTMSARTLTVTERTS